MGTFNYPKSRFNPEDWHKFLNAVDNASKKDYDSGWILKPSTGYVEHGLYVMPSSVEIQSSTSPDGQNWQHELATSVDGQKVSLSGVTNPYIRVLADK